MDFSSPCSWVCFTKGFSTGWLNSTFSYEKWGSEMAKFLKFPKKGLNSTIFKK